MNSSAPAAAAALAGPGKTVLRAENIEKTYDMDARTLRVLRGVSLEVRRGEILAVQGPSGAGKSTLLHILGLLDEPDRGRVYIDGVDVFDLRPKERAWVRTAKIGFVFQFYHLFRDLTALENVCLPRMVREGWLSYRRQRAQIEARARALLDQVGLGDRMNHLPTQLSGGERQRVAIARALMNEPDLVLCDEPTGNLDQRTAAGVLDLIWRLNEETGQTFVIVTHDEALARRAHRVVRIVDGAVANGGAAAPAAPPRDFERETRFRLKALPPRGGWGRPPLLAGLLGAVPLGAFWWTRSAHARFRRATRRGLGGLSAALLQLLGAVPVVGLLVPPLVQSRPLRIADEILKANGLGEGGGRRLPAVLWSLALFALFAAALLPGSLFPGGDGARAATLAGAHAALGALCAWLQALHNRFYDRIAKEDEDEQKQKQRRGK